MSSSCLLGLVSPCYHEYDDTSHEHRKCIEHPERDEVASEEISYMCIRKTKKLCKHTKESVSSEKKRGCVSGDSSVFFLIPTPTEHDDEEHSSFEGGLEQRTREMIHSILHDGKWSHVR